MPMHALQFYRYIYNIYSAIARIEILLKLYNMGNFKPNPSPNPNN
jgi:hypothetical protein